MFWRKIPTRLYVLSFLIIVGMGVAFYYFLGREADSVVSDQILRRKQTIARAQSGNIVSFFEVFGDSVALFAQRRSIERRDDTTIQDMDTFVEQWRDSGLVGGIVLTDGGGMVQFYSNLLGTHDLTGESFVDRDYFIWAKGQAGEGRYFVGQPVIGRLDGTKNQVIIPVASPVFQNEVFVGVLVAAVELHSLTERFVELMKVSDLTESYLVDERGLLIYDSAALDEIGPNIFEISKKNPFSGSQVLIDRLTSALNTKEEGKLITAYPDSKTGKITEYLIAYSPVLFEDRYWLLIITTPLEDVREDNTPIFVRLKVMFILVSLTILLYGAFVNIETKRRNSNNAPS